MKEDQDIMKLFVKIVARFPQLYDYKLDSYRTKYGELAWDRVAACVRSELNEECTVEELKVKWKGVRSSYNRYKHKVLNNPDSSPMCKKYYLYDSLRFLDPFTRLKGLTEKQSENMLEGCPNYVDVNELSGEYDRLDDWNIEDVKPNIITTLSPIANENPQTPDTGLDVAMIRNSRESTDSDKCRKRRHEDKTDDENEDLQFFKSILPDIKNFTTKEKRKLKMKILQIIDDIDNERKVKQTVIIQ